MESDLVALRSLSKPRGKPIGQRPVFAQTGQPAVDGIVVAPDHVRQFAFRNLLFDVTAIKGVAIKGVRDI